MTTVIAKKTKETKEKFIICESNQIIDSTHQLSFVEMRLLTYILANIYRLAEIEEGMEYTVNVNEYAEHFECSRNAAYEAIITTVDKLATRTLHVAERIYNPKASEKARRIIHWVDHIKYNLNEASVSLVWHRDLIPLLNQLGKSNPYSSYYLSHVSKLTSIHSIRLFRLLNRYKFQKNIVFSLEELRRLLGILGDEYEVWAVLNRDVIAKAVAEIHKKTELKVTYTPIRHGRSIGKVQFIIE